MSYEIEVRDVAARPTAVVAATTTWAEFPRLWPSLSGQVWASLRAEGITSGCPNVMLYLDDRPHVEVGVELRQPARLAAPVVASTLPGDRVATTIHQGSYSGLAAAHRAVREWCATHGHEIAGPRWEVYGRHYDDPAELQTEVYWLLS
jgi:effector-binding domain-containing protein